MAAYLMVVVQPFKDKKKQPHIIGVQIFSERNPTIWLAPSRKGGLPIVYKLIATQKGDDYTEARAKLLERLKTSEEFRWVKLIYNIDGL